MVASNQVAYQELIQELNHPFKDSNVADAKTQEVMKFLPCINNSAYKPSGKTTGKAILLILISSILAPISVWLSILFAFSVIAQLSNLFAIIFVFGSPIILGFLIGILVARAGKIGKNRNRILPVAILMIFYIATPFGWGFFFSGQLYSSSFATLGFLYVIFSSLIAVITASIGAWFFVEDDKFDELSQQFLEKENSKKLHLSTALGLIEQSKNGNYEGFLNSLNDTDTAYKNFYLLTTYILPGNTPYEYGYLEAEAFLTLKVEGEGQQGNPVKANWKFLSAKLSKEDMDELYSLIPRNSA